MINRMKTAGEILSALFDRQFMEKAQGYSKFFDSWTDITAKNGIVAAADHSRIKDVDRGIVLIEMDHPGWKQILQTKQSKLLNDFRLRFPELEISGISLMLGSASADGVQQPEKEPRVVENPVQETEVVEPPEHPAVKGCDAIKDEDFREKLIKLGHTVAEREKSRYKNKL